MTASSVEFFPCRVQLMGLPRSTSGISAASNSSSLEEVNIGINRRPPLLKVQKVSRNLFGVPDPVEMKNLYQQEAVRLRSYILERYNFDTKSSKPSNRDERNENASEQLPGNQNTVSSSKQPTSFPTLIEQELRQHEQRLQSEERNLCRTSSEKTPPNTKLTNHANSISKVTPSRYCEYSTIQSPAVERKKPYKRQSLLTESFNMRKNKVYFTRNTKNCNIGVITTDKSKTNKNIGVSLKMENNSCNVKHEIDDLSPCNNTYICALDKNDNDKNSTVICKDKHTALSLQLIVSTQNLS